MHVHVTSPAGEAKFWIEPHIELAGFYGVHQRHLNLIERLVRKHEDEIRDAWSRHFNG